MYFGCTLCNSEHLGTSLYCRLLARYLYTIGLKNFCGAAILQVFLDELNTSSCLGVFKEIIVDRTFDGNVSHPTMSPDLVSS